MSDFKPRFAMLAVLVLMLTQIAGGQNQTTPSTPAAKAGNEKLAGSTVEILLNQRDTLEKEITDLGNQIGWVQEAIALKAEREAIVAKRKPTEDIDFKLGSVLANAAMPGLPLTELDARYTQMKGLLQDKQGQKAAVNAELTRRATVELPKQDFKLKMSAVFAGLVGLVIVGFFVMAGLDEKVRREIFAGQAGIQFVTLFSLVIAIILFGIIDILEGKELAALLGGLSGYILGRATPTKKERESTEEEEKPTEAQPHQPMVPQQGAPKPEQAARQAA
jgi:hypothetical protein